LDLASLLRVFSSAQEETSVNRRTFFNAIAAAPALGLLRPVYWRGSETVSAARRRRQLTMRKVIIAACLGLVVGVVLTVAAVVLYQDRELERHVFAFGMSASEIQPGETEVAG
jgi:uncharacterized membrane protein YidH (DUF202 family)